MMLGSLGSEIKSPLKDESGDSNVWLAVLARSSSRVRSGKIKTEYKVNNETWLLLAI